MYKYTLNNLGGGFKYFLCSSLFGEMIQYDEHIFQRGWFNHQPVTHLPTIDPNFQRNIQAPLKHACLEKQQEIQGFMKGSYLQVDCCLIRPIISWGVNPYFVKPFVGPDDETPSS